MSKTWFSAVLGVAVWLGLSGISFAAPGGHGGGHSGGFSGHSGGFSGHSGFSGHNGFSGAGFNHGFNGGYGHSLYGRGYNYGSGFGLYYGLPGYGYSTPFYGANSYYYEPSYSDVQPDLSNAPQDTYSPDNLYAPPATVPSVSPATDVATPANFQIRVPDGAEIWFEGSKTSQTGSVRTFVSPAVQPGKSFTYDIRARWTGSGATKQEHHKVWHGTPIALLSVTLFLS